MSDYLKPVDPGWFLALVREAREAEQRQTFNPWASECKLADLAGRVPALCDAIVMLVAQLAERRDAIEALAADLAHARSVVETGAAEIVAEREARNRAYEVLSALREGRYADCDRCKEQAAEIARLKSCIEIEHLLASASEGIRQKQAAEIERLKVIVADDEKALEAWDLKLRCAINARMRLREAVIKFNESLKGKKGAILGGLSFAALENLRAVLENPHDD